MPFDPIVNTLINLFIVLAMFCIGLSVTFGEIAATVRDKAKSGPALVANIVIAPIVAILIVQFVAMPKAAADVLLLLGFAPGGINALQFSTKVKGHMASAAALFFLLSLTAIVMTPIAAVFILEPDTVEPFSYAGLGLRLILFILVPLAIGMMLRRATPEAAEKLYKPAMLFSMGSFIASVIISTSQRQDALGELGSSTVVGMLSFILITMAVGWAFGGPDRDQRQILAAVTNLRNVGLVYLIVTQGFADPMLQDAVLAFMALMVLPNLLLAVFIGVWRKKHDG
jgi:bile acid:Na+ symporter, BASS family